MGFSAGENCCPDPQVRPKQALVSTSSPGRIERAIVQSKRPLLCDSVPECARWWVLPLAASEPHDFIQDQLAETKHIAPEACVRIQIGGFEAAPGRATLEGSNISGGQSLSGLRPQGTGFRKHETISFGKIRDSGVCWVLDLGGNLSESGWHGFENVVHLLGDLVRAQSLHHCEAEDKREVSDSEAAGNDKTRLNMERVA